MRELLALGRALLADNAEHVAACRARRTRLLMPEGALVKLEVLYFDGCPSHEALMPRLRDLMARAGVDAPVELKRVASAEAAERERFLGSPTLRVDGRDVDPGAGERTDFGSKCRLYPSADGLRGMVPDELMVAAFTRARGARAAPLS